MVTRDALKGFAIELFFQPGITQSHQAQAFQRLANVRSNNELVWKRIVEPPAAPLALVARSRRSEQAIFDIPPVDRYVRQRR